MNDKQRIGIIDIGSNSVRLVLYEQLEGGAYRVIDESKESARLSERIREDGTLAEDDIRYVADILGHFQRLCAAVGASRIRAVATAAIRNAANSARIVRRIKELSGLDVEILSGEEEARIGFLGMINTTDIEDGYLVDIGGGSTEISLFLGRRLVRSVSFPFGCVNTAKRFASGGQAIRPEQLQDISRMVSAEMDRHPWCREHPGLPLVGLGGTVRTLSKIDQARKKYSLPLAHQYEMSPEEVGQWLERLAPISAAKRKKFEGLPDDRADLIVPGTALLHAIMARLRSSRLIVSGAGLRDGLFYETVSPDSPLVQDVVGHSVSNLLALHPSVSQRHTEQVNRLALQLYDRLAAPDADPRLRLCTDVASRLYRVGVTVNYYDYAKHTFYVIAHSRINGLSHREILTSALIASYKSKGWLRRLVQAHKDILRRDDFADIVKLGTLVRLAVATDRSGTQPVERLEVETSADTLHVRLYTRHDASIELRELRGLKSEFRKVWGLKLVVRETRLSDPAGGPERGRDAGRREQQARITQTGGRFAHERPSVPSKRR